MKTYVLTVSRKFPATHPRKGESTGFVEAIENLFISSKPTTKIHNDNKEVYYLLSKIETYISNTETNQ